MVLVVVVVIELLHTTYKKKSILIEFYSLFTRSWSNELSSASPFYATNLLTLTSTLFNFQLVTFTFNPLDVVDCYRARYVLFCSPFVYEYFGLHCIGWLSHWQLSCAWNCLKEWVAPSVGRFFNDIFWILDRIRLYEKVYWNHPSSIKHKFYYACH